MRTRIQYVVLAAIAVAAMTPLLATAGEPEMLVGRLVDMGSVPGKSTTYMTLNIESLTPDDEVVRLAGLLAESGQEAVISAMWDMDSVGWVKIGASLGYQVQIIRSLPTEDGGRIIRVVTDRPIMFYESMRGTRSKQYPFGLLELRFGPEGKGEGTLIAAAQLAFSKEGRLEIKSYGTQPFKIVQISPSKKKSK